MPSTAENDGPPWFVRKPDGLYVSDDGVNYYPYTSLLELRKVLQQVAIHGNATEMWSQCLLCKAFSKLDGKTMIETLTHKHGCILEEVQ